MCIRDRYYIGGADIQSLFIKEHILCPCYKGNIGSREACCLGYHIQDIIIYRDPGAPVSYTHLDVYTRQFFNCPVPERY